MVCHFFRKLTIFLEIVIHHKERGWSIVTNLNKKKSTRFSSRTQTHLLTDSNSFLDKPTTIFVSIFIKIENFSSKKKIPSSKNFHRKKLPKSKIFHQKIWFQNFFHRKWQQVFCEIEIKRILSRDLIIFFVKSYVLWDILWSLIRS